MDNPEKFRTAVGTKGSPQLIFGYYPKVTLEEVLAKIQEQFPNTPASKLRVLPGITFAVITTGDDFEV